MDVVGKGGTTHQAWIPQRRDHIEMRPLSKLPLQIEMLRAREPKPTDKKETRQYPGRGRSNAKAGAAT